MAIMCTKLENNRIKNTLMISAQIKIVKQIFLAEHFIA